MDRLCTVIIPCTRKEYIKGCVNSILDQSLNNLSIEILIINDNPENEELKEFLSEFSNNELIKVVTNEKNIGLSDTRNKGIGLANGEFIYFIDDDDYIKRNTALEEMFNLINDNNTSLVIACGNENISNIKFIEYYKTLPNDFNLRSVSNKFLRKSYLIENNLSFLTNKYAEEDYFNYSILLKDPEISVLEGEVYFYRDTEKSITKTRKYIQDLPEINNKIAREVFEADLDIEFKCKIFKNLSKHKLKDKRLSHLF